MTIEEILAALDNLDTLSITELDELIEAIATTYAEIRGDGSDVDDATLQTLQELRDAKATVVAAKDTKVQAAAEAAERLAALDAEMNGDEEGDESAEGDADGGEGDGDADAPAEVTPAEGDEDADGDAEEDPVVGGDEDEDAPATEEGKVLVTASAPPAAPKHPRLRQLRGQQAPARRTPAPTSSFGTDVVTASADSSLGTLAGKRITTGEAFVQALQARAESVQSLDPRDGFERFKAIKVRQAFDADCIVTETMARQDPEGVSNVMETATRKFLSKIGTQVAQMGDDVVLAAGGPCIPAEPDFDVEFIGDGGRPFSMAFPTVQYPRSRVSFYAPIPFSRAGCDPLIGRIITIAGDTAGYDPSPTPPEVLPKSCVRIECPDGPLTCALDIMLKCVTIGNWVDRSWPQWVRVFRENVDTCYDVAYEQKHMAQVVSGSTLITAGPATFGATVDFLGQILTLQARAQNGRRLSSARQWRLIVPEWFVTQLRIDVMRYMGLGENGFAALSITDAQVVGWLRQNNINVSVYKDEAGPTAQGDEQVLALPTTGALVDLPGTVRTFFFPEGTWVRGTGGELDLGVVRDSALNSVNDFQTFFEEWTTMCKRGLDSYVVDHVLCPSGLIGGTVVLECEGASA